MAQPDRPKKLQRISQACDLCHRRSIRCRPSQENPHRQCQNCYDFAVDCTYRRPSRRRRNQSVPHITPPNLLPSLHGISPVSPAIKVEGGQSASGHAAYGAPDYSGGYIVPREEYQQDRLEIAWQSFAAASSSTIKQYMEMYMETVYPMFPLFHGPTLWTRLRLQHHLTDRGFFASIMAACALASARARDGATGEKYQFEMSHDQSSKLFCEAAQDAIPKDLSKASGLGFLRACALLALASLQKGKLEVMHQYMGHYHTLIAIQLFHDEENWPGDISVEEKEERRRLFWSMYTWDVYTSVVFDTILKSQETQSNVRYPSEVNDEDLMSGVPSPTNELNWLRGWNFTTDLYRVLEHVIKRWRRNTKVTDDRIPISTLLNTDNAPDLQIMENITNMYHRLPAQFKNHNIPVTGDTSRDIYGFQVANIQATLQLVRMTLFDLSNWHDVNQKCDVAEEVLKTFWSIDRHYLKAISTPLVHHLGTIGQILVSVIQGPLTEDTYARVKSLLGSMADLLQGLESDLQPTVGASRGLRARLDKFEQYVHEQRQIHATFLEQQSQPNHTATPANKRGIGMSIDLNGIRNGALPITDVLAVHTPLPGIQIPSELTMDWPWPFDLGNQDGSFHLQNGMNGEEYPNGR